MMKESTGKYERESVVYVSAHGGEYVRASKGKFSCLQLAVAHKHLRLLSHRNLLYSLSLSLVVAFQSAGLACVCSELTNKCDATLSIIIYGNAFGSTANSICRWNGTLDMYYVISRYGSARVFCLRMCSLPHSHSEHTTCRMADALATAAAECFERFHIVHMRFVVNSNACIYL